MLPPLSHLQFAVLDAIGTLKMKGQDIRKAMRAQGISKSLPAFYQLMARMEDAGLVEAETETTPMDGFVLKERSYRVSGHGFRAMQETRNFYLQADRSGLQPGMA